MFDTKQEFDSFVQFLPDFCIEILAKILDGQNFRHQSKISTIPLDSAANNQKYSLALDSLRRSGKEKSTPL